MTAADKVAELSQARKRLETITDKAYWPARIPLGRHADFEGLIVHTNDVTRVANESLDGPDDLTGLMSAVEACQQIDRTLKAIRQQDQAQNASFQSEQATVDNLQRWQTTETNEEGLPIFDIQEELPRQEKGRNQDEDTTSSQAARTSTRTPVKPPETVLSKQTLDLLDRLEEEERLELAKEAERARQSDVTQPANSAAPLPTASSSSSQSGSKGFLQTAKSGFLVRKAVKPPVATPAKSDSTTSAAGASVATDPAIARTPSKQKKSVTFDLPEHDDDDEDKQRPPKRTAIPLPPPPSASSSAVARKESDSDSAQKRKSPLRSTVVERFDEDEATPPPIEKPRKQSLFKARQDSDVNVAPPPTSQARDTASLFPAVDSHPRLPDKAANVSRTEPQETSSAVSSAHAGLSDSASARPPEVTSSAQRRTPFKSAGILERFDSDDESSIPSVAAATTTTAITTHAEHSPRSTKQDAAARTAEAGLESNGPHADADYREEEQEDSEDYNDDDDEDDDDEEDDFGADEDEIDEIDVDGSLHMREVFLAYHATRGQVGAGRETGPLGGFAAVDDHEWQQEEVSSDATAFNKPRDVSKMSRFRSGRLGPHAVNLPQIVLSGRVPGLAGTSDELTAEEESRLDANLERLTRGEDTQ